MQRFQKFIGRRVNLDRIKEPQGLASAGVTARYVPDELEEFDEMEFGAGSRNEDEVVFTLVLEHGKLARISLGFIPPGGSEDEMMAFTVEQLQEVLAAEGGLLESFFESVLH